MAPRSPARHASSRSVMSGSLPIPRYSKGLGDRPNMGAPQSARNSRPDVRIQPRAARQVLEESEDRKSTRLNSSHTVISYAVFCLKKKIEKRAEAGKGFAEALDLEVLTCQLRHEH